MKIQDIIILAIIIILLGLIIYFSFIKPAIKKESGCSKCAYAKSCKEKNNNKNNCSK